MFASKIIWIARDGNGDLYMYGAKPVKHMGQTTWMTSHPTNKIPKFTIAAKLPNNWFPGIKGTDKKPFRFIMELTH